MGIIYRHYVWNIPKVLTSIEAGKLNIELATDMFTLETVETDFSYAYSFETIIGSTIYSGNVSLSGFAATNEYTLYGPMYKNGTHIGYISINEFGNIAIYDLDEYKIM